MSNGVSKQRHHGHDGLLDAVHIRVKGPRPRRSDLLGLELASCIHRLPGEVASSGSGGICFQVRGVFTTSRCSDRSMMPTTYRRCQRSGDYARWRHARWQQPTALPPPLLVCQCLARWQLVGVFLACSPRGSRRRFLRKPASACSQPVQLFDHGCDRCQHLVVVRRHHHQRGALLGLFGCCGESLLRCGKGCVFQLDSNTAGAGGSCA